MLDPAGMSVDSRRAGRACESAVADLPPWASDDPDLAELVHGFVDQLPERADAMERLLEREDLGGLLVEAHQLKGTAGAYGFPWISEAAAALESLVKAQEALDTVRLQVREVASLCRHAGRRR